MYPSGLAQLVEGWTKNIAAGARDARRAPVAITVACVAAALALGVGTAMQLPTVERIDLAWPASYVAVACAMRAALRRLGDFRWWTWVLFPLPLLVFVAVFARSLWRTYVRRVVTWRGRTISTFGARGAR
jgi:4,4'-diaponeurosporenoate glycosyltransferase